VWRKLLLMLLTLGTAAAVLDAYVRSPQCTEALLAGLQQHAASDLDCSLQVRALQPSLLPPMLSAQGVQVAPLGQNAAPSAGQAPLKQDAQPFIRLQQLSIQPRLWPNRHGRWGLRRVLMLGLQLDAVQLLEAVDRAAAANPKPEPSPGAARPLWALPLDVVTLHLQGADIALTVLGERLLATDVALDIEPAKGGGRSTHLEVGRLSAAGSRRLPHFVRQSLGAWLATPDGALPDSIEVNSLADGRIDGHLRGNLQAPGLWTLSDSVLRLGGIPLQLSGEIDLQAASRPAKPPSALRLRAQLKLQDRPAWLLPRWQCRGDLRLDGLALSRGKNSEARCTVHAEGLQLRQENLGTLHAEVALRGGSLRVEALRLDQGELGSLTGSGRLRLDSTALQLHAAARLHHASLPAVLQTVGVSDAWLLGRLDGDVLLDGQLRPWRLLAQASLNGSGLAVLGRSYRSGTPPDRFVQVASLQLQGSAWLSPQALALQNMTLRLPGSLVHLQGSVEAGQGLHLRLASEALPLPALGLPATLQVLGTAAFKAEVSGPPARPQVHMDLQIEDFSLLQHGFARAQAVLDYQTPEVNLTHVRLQLHRPRAAVATLQVPKPEAAPASLLQGSARITLGRPQPTLQGQLLAKAADLRQVLGTLQLTQHLQLQLDASLRGSVRFSGPLRGPSAEVDLQAEVLRVGPTAVGTLHFTGHLAPGAYRTELQLLGQNSRLQVTAAAPHPGQLQLQATLDHAPLALLNMVAPTAHFAGTGRGEVVLAGPLSALGGHVNVMGHDVQAFGLLLGSIGLQGHARAGSLALKGFVRPPGSAAQATTTLPFEAAMRLDAALSFVLHSTLDPFDASWLLPSAIPLSLVLHGKLRLQGALTRVAALRAALQLSQARLQLRGAVLHLTAPTTATYENGRLSLQETYLSGPKVHAQVGGSLSESGALRLAGQASADLRLADAFLQPLFTGQGPVTVALQVQGTLASPTFAGEAQLHHITLMHIDSQQSLEDLNSQLSFSGRNLVIQNGRAELGGGVVRFFGETVLGQEGQAPQLNLRADLNRVRLHGLADLQATVSGDLQLLGPTDDLLLRGGLKLNEARYTARIELDSLIPKRDRLPLRTAVGQPLHALRYRLHIGAANNVFLHSTGLETELQVDLTLTGSSARPGLLGSLTPLWAKARYRDNAFELVRASIDFVDEYRIFTEFQLQARTRACNMLAEVTINGNSDGYSVLALGQDDRGVVDPQDVLACLQFGLRLHDFEGNQRAPASYSDALPGSLDALWTVSGLDTKVKKLLPIDVDELRLTSGWSSLSQRTTARVLVGKELSNKVVLKYSRSLDEYNDQALSLEYRLAKQAALQGNWLSARDVPVGDFGVDLRLHWELR
jgi:hypothetical protein